MNSNLNNQLEGMSQKLIQRAEKIPFSAIDLPARARNALYAAGANSSLDALHIIINGFPGIDGIGAKTVSESQAAAYVFIQAIESGSDEEVDKLLDPREVHFSSVNGNIVRAFPGIIELYLTKKSGSNVNRNKDIINKRFALNGEHQYTLEDIGTYYDVTRERIRQIEAKTIKDIDSLLSGELRTKDWKIDDLLVSNYLSMKSDIVEHGLLVLKYEIESLLRNKLDSVFESNYLDLFMEILGYVKLPNSFDGFRGKIRSCWCDSSIYKKKEIESIFRAIDLIFDEVSGLSLFDLTIAAKKQFKKKISNEALLIALRTCEEIELVEDRAIIKFQHLRSASDKAYRILESSRKPLHFSSIAREINLLDKENRNYKAVAETNVKNQLVSDKRFSTTGKSGQWGLSSWQYFENLTIVDAIERVLHKSGKPMKYQEMVSAVMELRPDVSKNSISVYLNQDEKFSRVGQALYALKSWRIKPIRRDVKLEKVGDSVFFAAVRRKMDIQDPIPFPQLIKAVMDATGLKEASVRQRILKAPQLDVKEQKGVKYKIVSRNNNYEAHEIGKSKELLRDKVQNEIRSILFESPNIRFKKGDLYKEVIKNTPCLRPTFYQYLDKMAAIRTFKDGNSYYAVYDHNEELECIEINLGKYDIDSSLAKILKRPLGKLTIEEVDIALFELGRIFENTLKDYLHDAKNKKTLTVSRKDTERLANMINCVVREGIVTKGHHLNTLREERNNRAHGNIPNNNERRTLFNKSHYVADLFIRYIVLFYKKRQELKNLTMP